jgi:hypothetical protein
VHGPATARQSGGAHAGRHSPHGAALAQGCPVQVVGRGARDPPIVLGEEGPAPRRADTSPLRARRVAPVVGRRRRGAGSGSELLDIEATQTLHASWDRATVWSVSSESS